jgi:hypothetical protein
MLHPRCSKACKMPIYADKDPCPAIPNQGMGVGGNIGPNDPVFSLCEIGG